MSEMIAKIGADISSFQSAMQQVQSSAKGATDAIKNGFAGTDFKQVGQQFQNVGNGVADAGKKITGLTAPIAAVGLASAKIGMDFEQQMATVAAVSGATGDSFDALKEQARELGATTRFSASESAEGMEYLARAGFDTQDILGTMPALLDLAASSAVDLGAAADITSNIMSGFGMSAEESARVADVLAQASASSNVSVESLGESMKMVSPVANSLGIGLEETTAAIGLLGDAGISGSQAGNMLKTGLLNLASPSKQATEAMNALGMEMFNTDGTMKALPEVIGELEKGLEGMTDQQKTATLETLFGKEAVAGWSVLVGEGADALGDFTGELEESGGAASRMAEIMNDTTLGAWDSMKSAIEETALIIFENLQPAIDAVIEFVTNMAQKFQELSPTMQNLIVTIGLIAVALGPLLIIGGKIIAGIGAVISSFSMISSAITMVSGAFTFLLSPVGLVIAAIVAFIAIGVLVYQNWEEISAVLVAIWEGIKEVATTVFTALAEFFSSVWDGIKQISSSVWEGIKELLKTIWEGIKNVAQVVFDAIKAYFQMVLNIYKTIFTTVWNAIKAVITTVINAIKAVIEVVFNAVKAYIQFVLNAYKTIFTTVWNAIKTVITTVVNAIKAVIEAVFNAIRAVIQTIMNGISTTISTIWNAIKTTITTIVNGISTTITTVFNAVKSSVTTIFNGIKTAMTKPIDAAKDLIKKALDAIKGFFGKLDLKFPEIKMPKLPKFTMTGSFSLNPPSVPKLGVSWNAKGGIFNKPTIFNTPNAGLQGVGEAGSEAIIPLKPSVLAGIGKGIAQASNLNQSNQPSQVTNEGDNYKININIDGFNGNEQDARKLSEIVGDELVARLRRERGVR